jgi:flagellar motor switch protein FliM
MGVTLDEEEVSALMSAIQDGRVAATSGANAAAPAVPYDLASQDRIIRGQMPTLDAINEKIASLLGIGLTGRTRCSLRVSATPASLLKFLDFNVLLAPPATVCVLALGGSGQALVVLEPGLAEALLAAALGDRRARAEPAPADGRRDLTGVERLVLRRLLTILTEAMAAAWEPVLPFRPELLRFEADPRLAVIAPPNEVAVVSSFTLSGAIEGRLQLAIPYAVVEPAKKALSSPPRLSAGRDARFVAALAAELTRVEVELCAVLGRAQLPLERLLALDVGDVLVLSTSEGEPIPVNVQGRPKLAGHPEVSGGNLAVRVERGLPAPAEKPAAPAPPPPAPSPAPAPAPAPKPAVAPRSVHA